MTNEEEFQEWLKRQPQEVCTAIAYRAAMRVLPFATGLDWLVDADRLALATFRACLTSGVAAVWPTAGKRELVARAAHTASLVSRDTAHLAYTASKHPRTGASLCAIDSADSAAFAAGTAEAGNTPTGAVRSAVDAIAHSYGFSSASSVADSVRFAILADTERDGALLARIDIPLSPEMSKALAEFHANNRSALDAGGPWAFWAKWYARAMAGDPLDWKLQEQIALIPNEVWEAGPEAVAAEIARIEAEFALRKRISEFEAARFASVDARLGIGGNSPPEEIDDPQVARHVTIIWESIEGLKREVEVVGPDVTRVAQLIERLSAALKAVIAWCGRKGDLMVDTAIKYVIPAGATGYFVLMPAKAEAVLKAAQAWLPLLGP